VSPETEEFGLGSARDPYQISDDIAEEVWQAYGLRRGPPSDRASRGSHRGRSASNMATDYQLEYCQQSATKAFQRHKSFEERARDFRQQMSYRGGDQEDQELKSVAQASYVEHDVRRAVREPCTVAQSVPRPRPLRGEATYNLTFKEHETKPFRQAKGIEARRSEDIQRRIATGELKMPPAEAAFTTTYRGFFDDQRHNLPTPWEPVPAKGLDKESMQDKIRRARAPLPVEQSTARADFHPHPVTPFQRHLGLEQRRRLKVEAHQKATAGLTPRRVSARQAVRDNMRA